MLFSFNNGVRKYVLNDNWIFSLLFIFSLIFFLKQKKNRKRKKNPVPALNPALNTRGGDNSIVLKRFQDQCLSGDSYLQVKDKKIQQIVKKMLKITTNKPIVICSFTYMLAILKSQSKDVTLVFGPTTVIIQNLPKFVLKSVGSILAGYLSATFSWTLVLGASPLLLLAFYYGSVHINCHAFVDTLPKLPKDEGNFQYIETTIVEDSPIIIAPSLHTPKLLYQAVDETDSSLYNNVNCFIQNNCLGPEPIKRRPRIKDKRLIPLSERTKTLADVKTPIDEVHEITLENIKLKNSKSNVLDEN